MNYTILTNLAAMPIVGSYNLRSLEPDEFATKVIKAIDEEQNLRNFISNKTTLSLISALINIDLDPVSIEQHYDWSLGNSMPILNEGDIMLICQPKYEFPKRQFPIQEHPMPSQLIDYHFFEARYWISESNETRLVDLSSEDPDFKGYRIIGVLTKNLLPPSSALPGERYVSLPGERFMSVNSYDIFLGLDQLHNGEPAVVNNQFRQWQEIFNQQNPHFYDHRISTSPFQISCAQLDDRPALRVESRIEHLQELTDAIWTRVRTANAGYQQLQEDRSPDKIEAFRAAAAAIQF